MLSLRPRLNGLQNHVASFVVPAGFSLFHVSVLMIAQFMGSPSLHPQTAGSECLLAWPLFSFHSWPKRAINVLRRGGRGSLEIR